MGRSNVTIRRVSDDDDDDEEVATRTRRDRKRRTHVPPSKGSRVIPAWGRVAAVVSHFKLVRRHDGIETSCTYPDEQNVLVDRWPIGDLSVKTVTERWGAGTYHARYLEPTGKAAGVSAKVTISPPRSADPPELTIENITPESLKLRELELRHKADREMFEARERMMKEQHAFYERMLERSAPSPQQAQGTITAADVDRTVRASVDGAVRLARLEWENAELKRRAADPSSRTNDDDDDDEEEEEDGALARTERIAGSFARILESPVAGPILAPVLANLLQKFADAVPQQPHAPRPRAAPPPHAPQSRARPAAQRPAPRETPPDPS